MSNIKERIFRNINAKRELKGWFDEKIITAQKKEFHNIHDLISKHPGKSSFENNDFPFISLENHLAESGIFISKEGIN